MYLDSLLSKLINDQLFKMIWIWMLHIFTLYYLYFREENINTPRIQNLLSQSKCCREIFSSNKSPDQCGEELFKDIYIVLYIR